MGESTADKRFVIALDQGTTSSRAMLIDRAGHIVARMQREFPQVYPQPGWVEHDPADILSSQLGVLTELLLANNVDTAQVDSIGITNQRETTLVWDRETGEPLHNAIVWQCRRTAPMIERLCSDPGVARTVVEKTGLVPDPYFSASKIAWILDEVPGARERAEAGGLAFGTVDSWLIWKLTYGAVHATDMTNASRTMLYNIKELRWDEGICNRLGIPMNMLPPVRSSSEIYGSVNIQGVEVPIAGIAGDQQAALFGQTCFEPGEAKNTYGTGCFLLMNTGETPCVSKHGLITTIAIGLNGTVTYALEGSIFVGGAVVQWLRDEMGLISDSADTEYFAEKVKDTAGVYVVPAFTGLGAPHWDMNARGAILGLTRGAGRNHIIRAALESIAYQTADVLRAMEEDTGIPLRELRVDGGASANNFLMQFQADIVDRPLSRPKIRETTALGAACLAGLATGVWSGLEDIRGQWTLDRLYQPNLKAAEREALLSGWRDAVRRVRSC